MRTESTLGREHHWNCASHVSNKGQSEHHEGRRESGLAEVKMKGPIMSAECGPVFSCGSECFSGQLDFHPPRPMRLWNHIKDTPPG